MPRSLSRVAITAVVATLIVLATAISRWQSNEPTQTPRDSIRIGVQQLDSGKVREASSLADQLAATEDGAEAAAILRARIQLKLNAPESALRLLEPLDQSGPFRADILSAAGEALYRIGHIAQAERALSEAVNAAPDDIASLRWLSAALYDLGANDRAIPVLRRITELDPGDFRPHHLLARIHFDFEKYAEALADCGAALSRKLPAEPHAELQLLCARSRTALHEYQLALDIVATLPNGLDTRSLAAQCQWGLGHRDATQKLILQSEGDGLWTPALRLVQAEFYETTSIEHAFRELEQAAMDFPNDAPLNYALAQLFRKAGRESDADRQLARWQELQDLRNKLTELNLKAVKDPRDAASREELVTVCRQLGLDDLAAMWKRAADSLRVELPGNKQ